MIDFNTPMSLPRTLEQFLRGKNFDCIIGVDEAGRGPLCGPVVAAAAVFQDERNSVEGVADSKSIDENTRERVYAELCGNRKFIFGLAEIDNKRIDQINILQATFEAMTSAVDACLAKLDRSPRNVHILVDGPKVPPQLAARFACTPVVKGDGKEFLIAAASIIAKVARDKIMLEIDHKFPLYGLAKHKGYPTAEHMHLVRIHGPSEFHRLTFAPIKHMSSVLGRAKARSTTSVGKKRMSEATGSVVVEGLRRSARLRE